MCAGSRIYIAIRQPAHQFTYVVYQPAAVTDVSREPQTGVGTSSLLYLTNISDMFRTFLSDHLEVHRHNNVRQSQYLLNFYYVTEELCGLSSLQVTLSPKYVT